MGYIGTSATVGCPLRRSARLYESPCDSPVGLVCLQSRNPELYKSWAIRALASLLVPPDSHKFDQHPDSARLPFSDESRSVADSDTTLWSLQPSSNDLMAFGTPPLSLIARKSH